MSAKSGVTNQNQNQEQEVDIKPNIQPTHINVKIRAQDDDMEVAFSIKRNAPLKKLMNAYCDHKSVTLGYYTFLTAEGKRFKEEQTPDEVGMEDGQWRIQDILLGGLISHLYKII